MPYVGLKPCRVFRPEFADGEEEACFLAVLTQAGFTARAGLSGRVIGALFEKLALVRGTEATRHAVRGMRHGAAARVP